MSTYCEKGTVLSILYIYSFNLYNNLYEVGTVIPVSTDEEIEAQKA